MNRRRATTLAAAVAAAAAVTFGTVKVTEPSKPAAHIPASARAAGSFVLHHNSAHAPTVVAREPLSVSVRQSKKTVRLSWAKAPAEISGYQFTIDGRTVANGPPTLTGYTMAVPGPGVHSYAVYPIATPAQTAPQALPAGSCTVTQPGCPIPSFAPSNTVPPAVTGTAQVGQALSCSQGTWTANGTISGYSYVWQDASSPAGPWSTIAGQTSSTYTITSGEVSKYIRCEVTATNQTSSSQVASNVTAQVTSSGATSDCFASPSACGFPDPAAGNVGVPSGTTLTNSGGFTTSSNGQVINSLNVSGQIICNKSNVTIENSHLTFSGGLFAEAIQVQSGCTGLIVKNTTCNGSSNSGSGAMEDCIFNGFSNYQGSSAPTALNDYFYNCSDCMEYSVTCSNSYAITNGSISGAHYEDIYIDDGYINVNHCTLLNPQEQTATVFGDVCGGCGGAADNNITVTNSLMAGGGFLMYTNSGSTSVGTTVIDIANNRFARGNNDSNGYYPNGGSFGTFSWFFCPSDSPTRVTYTGNVWDDNNTTVPCTSQHV